MKSLAFLVLASAFALSACGGDDSGDGTTDSAAIDAPVTADARPLDAPPGVDAPPATSRVVEVPCPATPDATVVTSGGSGASASFSPMAVSIRVNGIVKFTMTASHSVIPSAPTTDQGLKVDFSATKCLQFTATDTFHYECFPHGFKGTIMVN